MYFIIFLYVYESITIATIKQITNCNIANNIVKNPGTILLLRIFGIYSKREYSAKTSNINEITINNMSLNIFMICLFSLLQIQLKKLLIVKECLQVFL